MHAPWAKSLLEDEDDDEYENDHRRFTPPPIQTFSAESRPRRLSFV
jgi:hypothetical protein